MALQHDKSPSEGLKLLSIRNLRMGAGGFEPPKAYANRFTACPLWPLGYTPCDQERWRVPNPGHVIKGAGCSNPCPADEMGFWQPCPWSLQRSRLDRTLIKPGAGFFSRALMEIKPDEIWNSTKKMSAIHSPLQWIEKAELAQFLPIQVLNRLHSAF